MKRRKGKNQEEYILIDLSDRKNIKIVQSKKSTVTDKDIVEFEEKLNARYNDLHDFTQNCLKKNLEKNRKSLSEEKYEDAVESMLKQNKLLMDMLKKQEGDI